MLNNILYRFSDGWDIITLGQVTPTLYMLSEDRRLWKKLCQYHFAEKQVRVLPHPWVKSWRGHGPHCVEHMGGYGEIEHTRLLWSLFCQL
jgi:hypothetical protein